MPTQQIDFTYRNRGRKRAEAENAVWLLIHLLFIILAVNNT